MIVIKFDGTGDISEGLIDQYGIIVNSQMVIWGEQQRRDWVELQPVEFYETVRVVWP